MGCFCMASISVDKAFWEVSSAVHNPQAGLRCLKTSKTCTRLSPSRLQPPAGLWSRLGMAHQSCQRTGSKLTYLGHLLSMNFSSFRGTPALLDGTPQSIAFKSLHYATDCICRKNSFPYPGSVILGLQGRVLVKFRGECIALNGGKFTRLTVQQS